MSTLGTRKAGLTREEIVHFTPNVNNDGTLTEILENLELSGFVRRYSATGKIKRDSIYQLIDNYTEESAWVKHADSNEGGAQVDLVIQRGDRVTNLCEMKFASGEYEISAAYETALRNKMEAFRRDTKTKDTLHLTFVTTYGLVRNRHASIARSQVTLDDLFKQ